MGRAFPSLFGLIIAWLLLVGTGVLLRVDLGLGDPPTGTTFALYGLSFVLLFTAVAAMAGLAEAAFRQRPAARWAVLGSLLTAVAAFGAQAIAAGKMITSDAVVLAVPLWIYAICAVWALARDRKRRRETGA